MIKKKSRFLTFIFSMFPGAGHMYMGFMKMGVSFASVFLFLMFISSWLHMRIFSFLIPLIWIYSFFDCMNKVGLDEDKLSLLEDKYLFSLNELLKIDRNVLEKRRLVIGFILLFLGIYLVGDNLMDVLERYIPYEIYSSIYHSMREVPQVIMGIVIVVFGMKLIQGKNRGSENECLREEE